MGFLSSRFGPVASQSNLDTWLSGAFARRSFAGKCVTEEAALRYSTYFACIRILSETLAMLPRGVFEEQKSGSKALAKEHPVNEIISRVSNPHMTSYVFHETLQGHIPTWGNAFAEIQRTQAGQVVALWPLRPDKTCARIDTDEETLYYETNIYGERVRLLPEDVLHIPGLGFNGYTGYSMIEMARETIGLGLAAEEFSARWFGQGTQGGHVVTHPGKLSKEGRENLREYMEEENSGLNNSHRYRILQEGMAIQAIGIKPSDADLLKSRNFQVAEIARFMRMQLSKLQSLERAIQNNIETQQIEFVVDTMTPWVYRWEQEMNRKLFAKSEQGRFYVKFNFKGLLRGELKAQAEYYNKACGGPWITVNEARALEDLEPIDGGDELRTPVNMGSQSDLGKQQGDQQVAA